MPQLLILIHHPEFAAVTQCFAGHLEHPFKVTAGNGGLHKSAGHQLRAAGLIGILGVRVLHPGHHVQQTITFIHPTLGPHHLTFPAVGATRELFGESHLRQGPVLRLLIAHGHIHQTELTVGQGQPHLRHIHRIDRPHLLTRPDILAHIQCRQPHPAVKRRPHHGALLLHFDRLQLRHGGVILGLGLLILNLIAAQIRQIVAHPAAGFFLRFRL